MRPGSGPGAQSSQADVISDEVLLDLLTGILLALEPARHPAPPRPSFVRLRVAVLRFHFAPATFPSISATGGIGSRATSLFRSIVAQSRKLSDKLSSLGRARLVMLTVHPIQRILLLVER